MTSAINPVSIKLYRMHYLVRVPLHLVCLFANCMNHSAILVSLGFTTLYDNVNCLTPARRQTVCGSCRTCTEMKPRFFKSPVQTLIKALRPWDRLSLEKGPVRGACPYLLVAVDEYSRFPFVFACKNMKSSTVTACLSSLFWVFVFPSCVHSDRGSPLSVRRRGHISPLATFLSARPPPTPYWEQPVRTVQPNHLAHQ